MGRTIDIDIKESEWTSEINARTLGMQECERVIQEQSTKKAKLMEEVQKYQIWINTAREMYGLEPKEMEHVPIRTPSRRKVPDKQRLARGILRKTILRIFKEHPQGTQFNKNEMKDLLGNKGIVSTKDSWSSVIYNAMSNLANEKVLIVEKRNGENYYRLASVDIDSALKS